MKPKTEQSQNNEADDIATLEEKFLDISKKLALAKKSFDILEKRHYILDRKLERAKGFLMRSEYDTIKCVGEELILLYYRGEIVMKSELDELVECYFRNRLTRVCPEEV